MKNAKIWNICSVVVWLLLAASEILLGVNILQLDMLPTKYLVIVFAALVLILVLFGFLMYSRTGKYQKEQSHVRQIVVYIFSVLIIAICLVGSYAISQVNNTISSVTEVPSVSAVVDVYVMADDPANSIEDTRDYTFAVTESYDWENTQVAIAAINDQLGTEITIKKYDSVFELIDALYAGEVDALFLNSAFVDILDELEGYTTFTTDAKIIFEYEVIEMVPQATVSDETNDTEVPDGTDAPIQTYGDESFVVYLSGSDTRSKVLTSSRSDVNILAAVNTKTKQILLVNTPRDYYISNPIGNGAKDKLTHCGIYGINCSMKALENLYNTSISYYAQINFTGFETLIDAIGGITVYSDTSFTTLHGSFTIKVGNNDLNGEQALSFARERYALSGGDNARGQNQMKVITAVIQKMCSGTTIISKYSQILDSLEGMFVTNMSQDEISDLVKMQLDDMASWNILSYAVTGTGGSNTTYSAPGMNLYVMYPNQSTVNKASELIDRVLSGDILTSSDLS